ncbi:MAG: hypothetical protein OXB92_04215 [Acidimicrobiaceae bacterium]|nr:hypothetical protein [Acidimicrobiia bacterium]MCY4493048.1 hypothetical protein [Acidimicrobiaceae bacterium]
MSPRQIAVTLVALIFIVAAALVVVSRGGDDSADTPETTTTSTRATTTTDPEPDPGLGGDDSASADPTVSTSSTTSIPLSVPIEVPAVCTAQGAGAQVVAEAAADAAVQLGTGSAVSTAGLGVVTFGLTVPAAAEASGSAMLACEPVSECYRVTPAAAPPGVSLLVHASTIERVDIVDGPVTTVSGYGIGTTAEQLVAAFGDQLEREVVDADTVNFVFVPRDAGDAEFRVVFTVEDGVVTTYRSGRLPMILQESPCGA